MKTSSHTNSLQEMVENKRKELQTLQADIRHARDKEYDLGPYLTAKMNMEKELEKLEQELAQTNQDKAPQQMQYNKQNVISTSVVGRRSPPANSSVKLEDKTSQGVRNKQRKDLKSNASIQQEP